MTTLAGKTLFITGASRGIGLAIALRAARDGANVAIAAKSAVPNPKLPGTIHSAAEAVTATGGGTVSIKKKTLMLKTVSANVGAGSTVTLKLKPVGKGAKKIAKALGAGKKVKAKLDVTMTDSLGDTFESHPGVKLK